MKKLESLMLATAAVFTMALSLPIEAKVTMPPFFSDHMVLQHSTDVKLWGTAEPGAKVSVKPSWGHALKTQADESGAWHLILRTPGPGGPYSLTVSDGEKLTFSDILCGEVWLCGGQSNMAMAVGGKAGKVNGWEKELAEAETHSDIRLLHVTKRMAARPMDTIEVEKGGWTRSSAETVDRFSATAWFFGKQIAAETHMPVGLIESCWGGTRIESWTSGQTLGQMESFREQVEMLKDIPDTREEQAAHFERQVALWQQEMSKLDYAYTDGRLVWAQPDADLSGWTACKVPGYLQRQGLTGYHGFFWMRRSGCQR